MIRSAILQALEGRAVPLAGREVSTAAGVAYKPTIDALGRLHDSGLVVRFGRKYSAVWALAGSPAALRPDPLGAVEAAWRGAAPSGDPHPHGGEGEATPGLTENTSVRPSKIFGA